MAIPDAIKNNFHTLEKVFKQEDIALLECRDRNTGEPVYAICAINLIRQSGREPEIEMVPFGLMFSCDPYEMLIPASDNEEKSRIVDLAKGESFGFLGFDFRRIRSRRGVWRPHYTLKGKKRTELLRKLKEVFRKYQTQPLDRIIKVITPILRGWVNYFRIGYAGPCFNFIRDWVEKKIRRHLMRARKRKGFGWKRWSKQWLYE